MAKLGSYYGLCPLIDQKNLLGVSQDSEAGHVIVTLGKNIAIKYRISDQKQIHSWRTKDKFSSPVVYDKCTNQYVAVFNQVFIRTWQGEEEYVDKLKKFKFNKPIHTLISCNQKCFLVFKNGTVTPLSDGLENRKESVNEGTSSLHTPSLDVLTAHFNEKHYVAVLSGPSHKMHVTVNTFSEDQVSCSTLEVNRKKGLTVKGQILCQIDNCDNIVLLILWSDGRFYSYSLDQDTSNVNETKVTGNLFSQFEFLSCKDNITMAYINQHHIGMYGADANEEGAALILYNTQFKVSQSKQLLKLFTSGAKLWKIENNLLFCSGQSLGVIPFYLDKEQLSSLVGSHRTATIDLDPDVVVMEELEEASWGSPLENIDRLIPKEIAKLVIELSQQGFSESTICEIVIPQYIENKNVNAILSCLDYFCDIPELYLVELLRFTIKIDSKNFSGKLVGSSNVVPVELRQVERCNLMNKILMSSFSDSLLLPHLHSKLDLGCTILLLQYIFYLMSSDTNSRCGKSVTEFENILINWCCVLLDANYQKFLLSRDTQIIEILTNFSGLVAHYTSSLETLQQTLPLLNELKKGKKPNKNKHLNNLLYSVEKLNLY
ncbi:hypothetical protein PPYR_14619 [Photinus pyralis]|uniref:Nucleolar protein 11 n=1 Tax=Photinus pyralis TaxID=7054 RepID=A0A1Y1M5S4_PHOPY|nr:nucleolar protein 11 [Photinus pyralis]KAB0792660.1 hypothetical protein PPYR_14619 [Photinus pyralis]